MSTTQLYNYFEMLLWLGFAAIFWTAAFRRGQRQRAFCIAGALAFMAASASELVEAYTGAWWRPWWLLAWKASFLVVFLLMFRWYTRIVPDWRQKILGKSPGKNLDG